MSGPRRMTPRRHLAGAIGLGIVVITALAVTAGCTSGAAPAKSVATARPSPSRTASG
jgi:hypothetical protein